VSTARYLIGDTRAVVATLPDASVDLVLTSPPFLALRSYLAADDPNKGMEIGQEANPAAFLDVLLELTAGWRRVLAPHGSIAVELGDTYSGSGGAGGDYAEGGLREGQSKFDGSNHRRGKIVDHDSGRRLPGPGWPLAKSLALVPELYRIALAYGINPLTGAPSPAGRWRVRNVVRWHRPNPPVGALGDKFRPATTDMVIACVSDRRWFDLDGVREAHGIDPTARAVQKSTNNGGNRAADHGAAFVNAGNPAGAPPLDTWIVPTEPYPGSHYATWPRALCVKPIKAMCPEKVCRTCGEPSRRIVEAEPGRGGYHQANLGGSRTAIGTVERRDVSGSQMGTRQATTVGWTDCGHDDFRAGVVLDPFGGSGTTGAVATGLGRDAILIDLDARNQDLARERIGLFMEAS
jgi:site-specific DNA-methyltransferase (adenine-specific)